MQESTTPLGLMSLNPSMRTQAISSPTPRFDFESAEDEGEMQAKSQLDQEAVQRVLKRIQARERG